MTKARNLSVLGATWIAVATLVACSSARGDFDTATTQNTLAAYQGFLKQHPNSDLAVQAQERIKVLQDEQAWASAQKTNTLDSFQQYLHDQPNGAHTSESRDRVAMLQRAAALQSALADGKQPAIEAFLQKYPQGPEAEQARSKLELLKSQQYRVQVAKFRAPKDIQRARTRMQAKYGKVLREVVVVAPTPANKLTTLRSAPMTLQDAKSACSELKKRRQYCEVVKG